jgi:hypothetical protein
MKGDRRLYLVLGLVLVLAAIFLLWRRGGAPAEAAHRAPPAASEAAAPAPAPIPSDRAGARQARDAMRADILDALRKRDAGAKVAASPASRPAAAAPPAKDDAPPGRYEPAYIQEIFHRDMFPFLRGCYGDALRRRPTLAGRLVLSFSIVGDPQVGGIVEDADFADESDLKDSEMETCVRESLMTITFDKPPSGGGTVTVKYPVLFSPGDDDEDAGTGAPVSG